MSVSAAGRSVFTGSNGLAASSRTRWCSQETVNGADGSASVAARAGIVAPTTPQIVAAAAEVSVRRRLIGRVARVMPVDSLLFVVVVRSQPAALRPEWLQAALPKDRTRGQPSPSRWRRSTATAALRLRRCGWPTHCSFVRATANGFPLYVALQKRQ